MCRASGKFITYTDLQNKKLGLPHALLPSFCKLIVSKMFGRVRGTSMYLVSFRFLGQRYKYENVNNLVIMEEGASQYSLRKNCRW